MEPKWNVIFHFLQSKWKVEWNGMERRFTDLWWWVVGGRWSERSFNSPQIQIRYQLRYEVIKKKILKL